MVSCKAGTKTPSKPISQSRPFVLAEQPSVSLDSIFVNSTNCRLEDCTCPEEWTVSILAAAQTSFLVTSKTAQQPFA